MKKGNMVIVRLEGRKTIGLSKYVRVLSQTGLNKTGKLGWSFLNCNKDSRWGQFSEVGAEEWLVRKDV